MKCVFCQHNETIQHLFFQCNFARSIWSVIQVASNLYPPSSVANIFGNWLHDIDHKYIILLRVGAIAIIWSLWLCRNDKVLMTKILLSCTLSIGVQIHFVYGRLYNVWSFAACLWRCLHNWRTRRQIFLPNMDGSVIFG